MLKLIEKQFGFGKREKVVIEVYGYDLQSSGLGETIRKVAKSVIENNPTPQVTRMSYRVEKSEPV